MRYEGPLYRPPSEADAFILQATIGCSWNHCTYCDMYRDKPRFRVRPADEIARGSRRPRTRSVRRGVEKVFVADGDALVMDVEHWEADPRGLPRCFPAAPAGQLLRDRANLLAKSDAELSALARRLACRSCTSAPSRATTLTLSASRRERRSPITSRPRKRARAAGMELSAIFLLGAGGIERSRGARGASAALATAMDPRVPRRADADGGSRHAAGEARRRRGSSTLPSVDAAARGAAHVCRRPADATRCSAPTTPPTTCRSAGACRRIASGSWRWWIGR